MKRNDIPYKKYIPYIGKGSIAILLPVVFFYLLESYTHNPFAEVRPWAQFFNIVLFELLGWLFVLLWGSLKAGFRTEAVLAMVYGIANAYVVRFRTNPIVPWDILSLKTAASVNDLYISERTVAYTTAIAEPSVAVNTPARIPPITITPPQYG